jgi:putative NIF3 family GTP cyclohydrolase 1 type 2
MIVKDVQSYLDSLLEVWEAPAEGYDMLVAGDLEAEVKGIAVAWMSYRAALAEAVARGCNLFITHEPTFYNHFDRDPAIFRFPEVAAKKEYIERHNLTIVRCHDLWDQVKDVGIPDAWGRLLGFGQAIDGDAHIRVYDAGGRSALEVARQVAARAGALGQEAVQFIGPAERPVHRVCTGTGAITPFQRYLEKYEADLAVCTDDGLWYWRDAAFAIDFDIPLVVVNHAVSEESGMAELARLLQERFTGVPVHHIAQKCMYRLVAAS